MTHRLFRIFIGIGVLVPLFAAAQITPSTTPTTFAGLVGIFLNIISLLIPLVAGLSFIVFLWGLSRFIISAGDEKARTSGKQLMIWGVIAFFVMSSVWGIVIVVANTFGFRVLLPLLPIPV